MCCRCLRHPHNTSAAIVGSRKVSRCTFARATKNADKMLMFYHLWIIMIIVAGVIDKIAFLVNSKVLDTQDPVYLVLNMFLAMADACSEKVC